MFERCSDRWVSWLEEGSLRTHDLNNIDDGEAAWQLLRTCQPVHMTKSCITGCLSSDLSFNQLVWISCPLFIILHADQGFNCYCTFTAAHASKGFKDPLSALKGPEKLWTWSLNTTAFQETEAPLGQKLAVFNEFDCLDITEFHS